MRYKEIRIGMKRTVRHRKYQVSTVECELVAEVSDDDDLESVYREVKNDVEIILDELEESEREKFSVITDRR